MVGQRFRLTLRTTWRILLKTNVEFLKLKNRQRRPLTLKERNLGLNQVLLITNLIMILFLLLLIYASALTKLSSSFDKPHFCPDLSSGEEPASRVDGKDTGETTAPILFLQEHQISQPSDAFDFEKSSDSCLFKVGSLREHVRWFLVLFHSHPTLSPTLLLKATEFLSLICQIILLFPIDLRPSSFWNWLMH